MKEIDPRMRAFRTEELIEKLKRPGHLDGPRRGWVIAGLMCLAWLAVLVALRLLPHTGGTIQMHLRSDRAGIAQWFYDRGNGYSEEESITAALHVGENLVSFNLPEGRYRALRFDPINNDGRVKVESLHWVAPVDVDVSQLGREQLTALAHIDHVTTSPDGIEISPVSASNDPQMQLPLSHPLTLVTTNSMSRDAISAFKLACALLLMGWMACTQITVRRLVAAGMWLAAGLILAMALTSTTARSVHPDEFTHLGAYEYYLDHWLPPAANDPATDHATSVWGGSYLTELDVIYDVAAHSRLTVWTSVNLHAARLFQFGLWLILCVLALFHSRWVWVISVMLLSPQIWYVFAYFNADAFPLLLSFIAAGLIADTGSGLHRFVQTGNTRNPAVWVTAVCIGLLFVSKLNYLPVVPVLLLWIMVLHLDLRAWAVVMILSGLMLMGAAVLMGRVPAMIAWHLPLMAVGFLVLTLTVAGLLWNFWKDIHNRKILLHLIAFILICMAIAAPRLAWDVKVNGWPAQKRALVEEVVEARAAPGFKPSDLAAGRSEASIALAARGVSLQDVVFAPYHWAYISTASAFGVYGYMNVWAPTWLYMGLFVLTISIFSIAVYAIRQGHPRQWLALTSIVLGGSVLVLASSLLLSWVNAFQPQGRYLLPMAAMLALMVGHAAPNLPKRIFSCLAFAAFLLSVASFAFFALPALSAG